GRDARRGGDVAVDDVALIDNLDAETAQRVARQPVRGRAPCLQHSSLSEQQGAGTDGADPGPQPGMLAEELHEQSVLHQRHLPWAGRHDNEVERRSVGERDGRAYLDATVRLHRARPRPDQVGPCLGKTTQHFPWANEIQWRVAWIDQETDV